ncbi:Nn.00g085260.m01.CDS01 [Neocucurbitaria sp. VM-36]
MVGVVRSNAYGLKGSTSTTSSTTIEIVQTINNLAAGTAVNIGGYVKALRTATTNSPLTFSLYFDGVLLDRIYVNNVTTSPVSTNTAAYQLMTSPSNYLVTGGNSHTLKLRVETSGYSGQTFAADDFYVIVASGPGNVPGCDPIPVPTRPCFSAPASNLVKNPGFDYDATFDTSMAYWSVSQDPGYSRGSWVYSERGRTSTNGFLGYTVTGDAGKVDSTQYLQQQNIDVPEGSIIDVSGYVNPRRAVNTAAEPFSITLKFDGQVVQTIYPSDGNVRRWTRIGTTTATRFAVVGSGPHTLSLEVRTAGYEYTDIYWADDFAIQVITGPTGERLCVS